jgi:GcrA cell cycle regulator
MSWTDERVELLKKLWNQGLSASQIAGELAGGVTRNAVIGKVHRLGLSGRTKAPAPQAARPRKATRAPSHPMMHSPPVRGNLALSPKPIAPAMPAPVIEIAPAPSPDVVIPISERVTIMELRESMCRWPHGDPTSEEFRFCGAKSPPGTPYCPYHSQIAYQPSLERRRDRKAQGMPPVRVAHG